jgi:gluconolactonase
MRLLTRSTSWLVLLALLACGTFCRDESWTLFAPIAQGQEPDYPVPAEATRAADVPEGKLEGPLAFRSKVYPGTERDYWIYVPAQYKADKPAALMIVQDGLSRAREWNLPEIFDNLIHKGEMPVTIGIFVNPGVVPTNKNGAQPRFNRSFEYDSLGDNYARFLIEELIPEVGAKYSISNDPNQRALAGASSGAICAFNAAWERPDAFRRVLSTIGTYVGLRGANELPVLIRKTEPKPLRVFLQDGSADLNIYAGDWWVANQSMLSALQWAGYDVEHSWIEGGGHNGKHAASIMPDALRWLWRDFPEPIKITPNPQGERRIDIQVPGSEWQQVSSGHEQVDAITCNATGTLFFCDSRANRIYRVDNDGKVRVFKEMQGRISSMQFGADDKLYLVRDNKQIVKLDAAGNEEVVVNDQRCHRLLTLPQGIYFTDDVKNSILWLPTGGQVVQAHLLTDRPIALVPSADQAFMHVASQNQSATLHLQIADDFTLTHRQRFGYLHMPYMDSSSGVAAMVSDDQGRVYVATSVGVQVMDQLGRVNVILTKPSRSPITSLTIGNAARDTLFLSDGQAIYARKLKIRGVRTFEPPVSLPKPGL